jgi:transposase-like protein
MGSILVANCKCGFRTQIFAGGGGFTHLDKNFEPALCPSCRHFHVLNYSGRRRKCPDCKAWVDFYNDPALGVPVSRAEMHLVFNHQTPGKNNCFILPETRYLCPSCGKKTMEFWHTGFWD